MVVSEIGKEKSVEFYKKGYEWVIVSLFFFIGSFCRGISEGVFLKGVFLWGSFCRSLFVGVFLKGSYCGVYFRGSFRGFF